MSSLFSGLNARLRGKSITGSRSPSSSIPASPTTLSLGSQSSTNLVPQVPPLPSSPSFSQSFGLMATTSAAVSGDGGDPLAAYRLPSPLPLWLNPNYARHIVKGNFMTLSARPKTVERGEWLAHQVVEHYRNLWNFVRVVYETEEDGTSICSAESCPRMTAGANHVYTWLDSARVPKELPAPQYHARMQYWISKKIDDAALFPTDPAGVSYEFNATFQGPSLSSLVGHEDWLGKRSGFPQELAGLCRQIFQQMFRVYAHMYWSHFTDFYHLNLEKALNSCFSHFVLTATALDMLTRLDIEPMQPLIDLWAANGTFPPQSHAYGYANLKAGEALMQSQQR